MFGTKPIPLEEQLAALRSCGIAINPGIPVDSVYPDEETREEVENSPFDLDLLYRLGHEIDGEAPHTYVPVCDKLWVCDVECVDDPEVYAQALQRLERMSGKVLGLSAIEGDIDFEEERFAYVAFEHRGHPMRWDFHIDADWMDCTIFLKYDALLKSHGDGVRLYANFDGGQAALFAAFTEEEIARYRRVAKLSMQSVEASEKNLISDEVIEAHASGATGEDAQGRSPENEIVDRIVDSAEATWQDMGFRRQGRTFNRETEDGLVHVVNFQMGGGNLAGHVAVNLGVQIPCVYKLDHDEEAAEFYSESGCYIRKRLGRLAAEGLGEPEHFSADVSSAGPVVKIHTRRSSRLFGWLESTHYDHEWYDLTSDPQALCDVVTEHFRSYGLPFLGRFASHQDVLVHVEAQGGLPFCNDYESKRIAGVVLARQGRRDEAVRMLEAAFDSAAKGHPPYRDHIKETARKLDLTLER